MYTATITKNGESKSGGEIFVARYRPTELPARIPDAERREKRSDGVLRRENASEKNRREESGGAAVSGHAFAAALLLILLTGEKPDAVTAAMAAFILA